MKPAFMLSSLLLPVLGGCSSIPSSPDARADAITSQPDAVDDLPSSTPDVMGQPDVVPPIDTGTCAAPRMQCDDVCTDVRTDNDNCGSCNNRCVAPMGGTSQCVAGSCNNACPAGRVLCGTRCVDLQTDIDNCGACGYRVVSAGRDGESSQRTCVAGRPSPAWVAVSMVGSPAADNYPAVRAWTGRRLLVAGLSGPAQLSMYAPASNTWTTAGTTLPFADASALKSYVNLPDRGIVMIWAGEASRRSNFAYVVRDDGTNVTITNSTPWPLGNRESVSMTYDGTNVHVMYGNNSTLDDGGIYNVATDSWTMIPSTATAACGTGGAHGAVPTAYARGVVNAFGGYRATLPYDFCRANDAFGYDTRASAWLPIAQNATAGFRIDHTWLAVGDLVFLYGGTSPTSNQIDDAWLLNPAERSMAGWTRLANVSSPTLATNNSFSMYTGKSIFLYSGSHIGSGTGIAGGSLGLISGASVRWSPLPTTGAPSPRAAYLNAGQGNAQPLWTGREAIVWGGNEGPARGNGARYQPPVACVCPSNVDAPRWMPTPCTDVSMIADAMCVP